MRKRVVEVGSRVKDFVRGGIQRKTNQSGINLENKFKDFLKEKNENGRWKHGRLRSAIRSLKDNLEYLFTQERYPELNIPNTTNSCEGSFGHWKSKVKLHRGISTERRKQMISKFLS